MNTFHDVFKKKSGLFSLLVFLLLFFLIVSSS